MACDNSSVRDRSAMAAAFRRIMATLPFVSDKLPGIGGTLKAEPEHFQVTEHLPYEPCGQGEHLYITLRRKGWNTADVGKALGRCLGLRPQDVGWGGRKDRRAVCTQTFSLCLSPAASEDDILRRLADLPFEIVNCRRHRNKIKTGHVAANRFRILLSGVRPDRMAHAAAIAEWIKTSGGPNFYGPQRFGINWNNIETAVSLLDRPRAARGAKGIFMVSVLQSALFNQWLCERMENGVFNSVIRGDVAQKTDTGGMFVVEDADEATRRLVRGAIVYTGPIYGYKMMAAGHEAALREEKLLADYNINLNYFNKLHSSGSRRPAILQIPDLSIEPADNGLLFNFTLPSGAFATTVMREFMREPID